MISELKKLLPQYTVEIITIADWDKVLEVYNTNQDFFMLSSGRAATAEDIKADIAGVPPGFGLENKFYISLWKDNACVGVLEFLDGYPAPQNIWIGLLLIHGSCHRKGVGREIASAVSKAAGNRSCISVQLGVLENNRKARNFWTNIGFEKIRESKIKEEGKPGHKVFVMEKRVV